MGATTILYEGKPVGTPDPGAFWRVISDHRVKVLFTAPTAFRAIKREDAQGEYLKKYDISHFDSLFLAGERLDPDTYHWAAELLKKPVIDHWWPDRNRLGHRRKLQRFGDVPGKTGLGHQAHAPGYAVTILDPENGKPLPANKGGAITVKLASAPREFHDPLAERPEIQRILHGPVPWILSHGGWGTYRR